MAGELNGNTTIRAEEVLRILRIFNYGTIVYGILGICVWAFKIEGFSSAISYGYCAVLLCIAASNRVLQHYGVSGKKRRGGFYAGFLFSCWIVTEIGNVVLRSLHKNPLKPLEGFALSAIETVALYLLSATLALVLECRKSSGGGAGGSKGRDPLLQTPEND